ncbi:MAG: hypothetical protein ACTSWW_00855 [Promethearchaeota archaeon]
MTSPIFHPRKDQILQRLQELSFPRMIGTQGEKHAQLYLLSLLKKLGFTPKIESFLFNPPHVLIDVIKYGTIIALGAILAFFFWIGDIVLIAFSIGFQWCIFALFYLIQKVLRDKLTHKLTISSKNLCVTQESQRGHEFGVKMAKILLVTHYDSQNTTLSPKITFLMQKFLKFSIILLHFFTLLYTLLPLNYSEYFFLAWFRILAWIFLIISIISALYLEIDLKGDFPHGRFNNATGTTIVLSLLDRIKESQTHLDWCDLEILFTSGTDQGRIGSKAYFLDHEADLCQYKDVYILNIDSIARSVSVQRNLLPLLKTPISPFLSDLVFDLAQHLNISVKNNSLEWTPDNDAITFFNKGQNFHVCSFISPADKLFPDTHIDFAKFDPKILLDATELLFNLILTLDQRINDKVASGE